MRTLSTLLLLLTLFKTASSQSLTIEWQRTLGGIDYEIPKAIKPTADGGYIVGGTTFSQDGDMLGNKGSADAYLIKLHADGSVAWKRTYGGSNDDGIHSLIVCADGGYLFTGYTKSKDGDIAGGFHGISDAWVVRLDAAGNILWQKVVGGSDYDVLLDVQQLADSEGGFILAGYTMSKNGDIAHKIGGDYNQDVWMMKLGGNGGIQWEKTFGGTDHDVAYALQATYNGFVVCAISQSANGQITHNKGQKDVWVYKVDYAGTLVWQYNYGGTGNDFGYAITAAQNGEWVIAGGTTSTDGDFAGNHGTLDAFVLKLDADGKKIWSKCYGGSALDQVQQICAKNDGSLVLTGTAESTDGDVAGNYGKSDFWAVGLTATGNIQWQQNFGGSDIDDAFAGTVAAGGNSIVLAGTSFSADRDVTVSKGGGDIWVIKVQPKAPMITQQPANIEACAGSQVQLTVKATQTDTYQWQQFINNQWQALLDNALFQGTQTGTLTVKDITGLHQQSFRCVLKNAYATTTTNRVSISVMQLPVITLQPADAQTCSNAAIRLLANANGASQWQWQQKKGTVWQNMNNEQQPTLTVKPAFNALQPFVEYRLVAKNACGSVTSASAKVTVWDCSIPNAFSPNGDNTHDTWNLNFLKNFPGSTVEVFTRGGNLVYEQRTNNSNWDGTYNGKPLPSGVYYYVVRIKALQQELKGALLLIR
jgi:gliding motility-associated-like protein